MLTKEYVSIKYNKKPAGKVLLRMTPENATYQPNSATNPAHKQIPNKMQAEDMIEGIYGHNMRQQPPQMQYYRSSPQQTSPQQSFSYQPPGLEHVQSTYVPYPGTQSKLSGQSHILGGSPVRNTVPAQQNSTIHTSYIMSQPKSGQQVNWHIGRP